MDMESIIAGSPAISRVKDSEGVVWLYAGHLGDPVPGDGTAECESLREMGLVAKYEPADCDCGCEAGQCRVYRVL